VIIVAAGWALLPWFWRGIGPKLSQRRAWLRPRRAAPGIGRPVRVERRGIMSCRARTVGGVAVAVAGCRG
jgi:hypothetical protein